MSTNKLLKYDLNSTEFQLLNVSFIYRSFFAITGKINFKKGNKKIMDNIQLSLSRHKNGGIVNFTLNKVLKVEKEVKKEYDKEYNEILIEVQLEAFNTNTDDITYTLLEDIEVLKGDLIHLKIAEEIEGVNEDSLNIDEAEGDKDFGEICYIKVIGS